MNYHSINDLVELCHKNNAQIWQVIMMDNAHERMVSEDKIFENMRLMYKAMKTADNNYDKSLKSPSRMAGGDGELMYQYNKSGRNICGDFVGMVMEKALKMGESNACMRRIVAAPTAGSCGVIPAVFISYETYFKALEDDMVKALLIASGIGAVIAENASIAGASGGCQAEIGSASAMAAAGLTFLQGGDSMQIVNSSALALKSMLGLACDPVCGLVEVPCIKRNVAGAMNAITAAQMSMAGIKSVISPDEVIDFFDFQLNTLALNLTHDKQLQSLNMTDKDIEFKKTGQGIGLQFGKYSPLLNYSSNGIPRKGLTMFASYTNGGKTSFVFENIVIPLAEQGTKICIISNEQDAIIFKDLLYIHVLTSRLDYWNIDRRKLKNLNFTKQDEEAFKKADKIVKEDYLENILFQRVYDYGMKNIKRTIKKLAKQDFDLFVYDTFKVDATTDTVWQSFLNDSKELFQIASKENVAVITPVQLSLSTKGKVRWLNESVLSNSKQISEIYEEIFMFRDIWSDEYTSCEKDLEATSNTVDGQGRSSEKVPFPIVWQEGKFYKIFFHVKSRNGENGQTILYEFIPNVNKWKEIGNCKVGEENKI